MTWMKRRTTPTCPIVAAFWNACTPPRARARRGDYLWRRCCDAWTRPELEQRDAWTRPELEQLRCMDNGSNASRAGAARAGPRSEGAGRGARQAGGAPARSSWRWRQAAPRPPRPRGATRRLGSARSAADTPPPLPPPPRASPTPRTPRAAPRPEVTARGAEEEEERGGRGARRRAGRGGAARAPSCAVKDAACPISTG